MIRSEPVSSILGQGAALVRAEFMEGYRGICRTLPVDDLSIAIVSFAEDEVVWANTGSLMHCDGRGSAQTFFPRPGPGESLRIAAQMIAQDEQTQAVLAA
ncbi:MAG: hypothetical protein AAFN59_13350 [Pseudomonadota bacterium]